MCLDSITTRFGTEDNSQSGVGWKVFRISLLTRSEEYFSLFCFTGHAGHNEYMSNKWYTRLRNVDISSNQIDGMPYEAGFHIFLNEDDAILYKNVNFGHADKGTVIRKVSYRNLTTIGKDGWAGKADVVVAREMKIEQETN